MASIDDEEFESEFSDFNFSTSDSGVCDKCKLKLVTNLVLSTTQ